MKSRVCKFFLLALITSGVSDFSQKSLKLGIAAGVPKNGKN